MSASDWIGVQHGDGVVVVVVHILRGAWRCAGGMAKGVSYSSDISDWRARWVGEHVVGRQRALDRYLSIRSGDVAGPSVHLALNLSSLALETSHFRLGIS
jgi:hypothetical protein